MPDKSDEGGQPSMEKLEREGVSIRKCIGMGDSYGGNGGGSSKPEPKGALASMPMRRGPKPRGGY